MSYRVWNPIRSLCLALCLAAAPLLGGCVDAAQLAAMRDQAIVLRGELAAEAEQMEAEAATPETDPAIRQANLDAADQLRQRLASLDQAIAAIDAAAGSAQNPDDAIHALTTQALPLLPEPLRSPALLVGALVVALLRANQLKRAAGSIAASIAKAAEKDEELRSAIQRQADTLRSVQTPTAKRIVDERTAQGFMLKLPV